MIDKTKILNAKKSIDKVLENFWINLNSNFNDSQSKSLNLVKFESKIINNNDQIKSKCNYNYPIQIHSSQIKTRLGKNFKSKLSGRKTCLTILE